MVDAVNDKPTREEKSENFRTKIEKLRKHVK